MARKTIASLEARIAELEAALAAVQTKKQAPKGACIVTLNGKARMSTLSHKDAYHFMVLAQQHGMRAQYRPYH